MQQGFAALGKTAGEQAVDGFRYDIADYTLPYLAKLQESANAAIETLLQAESIQKSFRNQMGETRTLLLEARVASGDTHASSLKERIRSLKEQVPALGQCKLLKKVVERWEEWTSGNPSPDETGDVFWGV
jgi:hypothetical protein